MADKEKVTVKQETKKPTGLSIKRDGDDMKVTWKIGDKNYSDGQQFYWRTNQTKKGKWFEKNVGRTTTAKSIDLDFNNYIPNTGKALTSFRVKIRGNREEYKTETSKKETTHKMTWSDYAFETFTFKKPRAPKVSVSTSDEYINKSTFHWTAANPSSGHRVFSDVRWQSVLLKNSNVTNGKKAFKQKHVSYASGTGGASDSQPFVEDLSYIGDKNSYTRWFRVRSRGPAGVSKWVYKKHVYSTPNNANNVKIKTWEEANGILVSVEWDTDRNAHTPIDYMVVQYAVGIPSAGMTAPSGLSWTDAAKAKPKDNTHKARFVYSEGIEQDEALFIRINTWHDQNETQGNPKIARVAKLKPPTLTNVVTADDTHRATITATNNSDVPGSFLAVRYKSATAPNEDPIIGVITGEDTSVTVQAPNWGTSGKSFGVQAYVGEYTAKTRDDGVTVYSITSYKDKKLMSSNKVWDNGQVPKAPEGVTVEATDTPGTVHVTWNNTWTAADAAELSWADHEDAWQSTAEPESYIVSNVYAASWNISGLEVGQTWYIRVRLLSGTADDPTPGPWSGIETISLAEAPNTPALVLSQPAIPESGTVTASWAYVSNDGTPQTYAEICQIADITQPDEEYVLTTDTVAVVGEDRYYIRSGSGTEADPYVYKNYVVEDYTLTADVTVEAGKVYYARSGSGTASSPYRYTKVENPTGNPHNKGYYETDGTSSVNPSSLGLYEKNYRVIAKTQTAQHIDLVAAEEGWTQDETYNLAVRVGSDSGLESEWSDPVPLFILKPLTIEITQTSLENVTVIDDGDDQTTSTVLSLTDMPLTITVTGAGATGTTTVTIERAESYYLDRPNERDFTGHEGETIVLFSQVGESQITIDNNDLIGTLDDGAQYRIIATVQDGFGQSAETTLDFEVHWEHQAMIPSAEIEIDNENYIAKITPIAPNDAYQLTEDETVDTSKKYYELVDDTFEEVTPVGAENPQLEGWYELTDVCDIYRLSVDRPELVYQGAEFGTMYVDPYPALGEMGGHRIVFRTKNGDYITDENTIAWADYRYEDGDGIDTIYNIIDFDGGQARVMYDITLQSGWEKDFQETKYLGGHIQGDWNPAVSRTGSVSGAFVAIEDQEMIQTMRRLADTPSICHVRTRDGSSYAADVQVSESRDMGRDVIRSEFTLSITRVDPEGFDGMTYADWITNESTEG